MTVQRKTSVSIDLTPKELAEEFWFMDGDQQAAFFNHLDTISGLRLPLQLAAVEDSVALLNTGRSVMRLIGSYGENR